MYIFTYRRFAPQPLAGAWVSAFWHHSRPAADPLYQPGTEISAAASSGDDTSSCAFGEDAYKLYHTPRGGGAVERAVYV